MGKRSYQVRCKSVHTSGEPAWRSDSLGSSKVRAQSTHLLISLLLKEKVAYLKFGLIPIWSNPRAFLSVTRGYLSEGIQRTAAPGACPAASLEEWKLSLGLPCLPLRL